MNTPHPSNEELLLHLEGESSTAAAKRVEDHLSQCPQCAAEIAGWRRSMQKLQNYDWPQPQAARRWNRMFVKLAAAAVIMAGLGFGIGRSITPNSAGLRASSAAELRGELAPQLRAELVADLQAVQKRQEENQRT